MSNIREPFEVGIAVNFADLDRTLVTVHVTEAPVNDFGDPVTFALKTLQKEIGTIDAIGDAIDCGVNEGDTERVSTRMQQTGGILAEALFPFGSSIRDCIDRSLTQADLDSTSLRIKLHISASFPDLPWEWLYYRRAHGEHQREFFFVHGPVTSLVRQVGNCERKQVSLGTPVRILLVLADSTGDLSRTIENEHKELSRVFQDLIAEERLEVRTIQGERTLEQLLVLGRSEYRPHIMHIIGHGDRDENGLYLAFEGTDGEVDKVRYARLQPILQALAAELQFVFLNTCRLGASNRSLPSGQILPSIDPEFAPKIVTDLDVPAVIAMKYAISFSAAEVFSPVVYTEFLGHGICIDQAFGRACVAVSSQRESQGEWGTPVLFVSDLNQPTHVQIPADTPGQSFRPGLNKRQVQMLIDRYHRDIRNWEGILGSNEQVVEVSPLPTFRMDIYQVTNRVFAEFVLREQYITDAERKNAGKTWRDYSIDSEGRGLENNPVVCITLSDAKEFCKWLSKKESRVVRLPTADEWEKAARGNDARLYPWGNDFDPNMCVSLESNANGTRSVFSNDKTNISPFGIKDLVGNVVEWTTTVIGKKYVVMGGSWFMQCAISGLPIRYFLSSPSNYRQDLGFRCVRE